MIKEHYAISKIIKINKLFLCSIPESEEDDDIFFLYKLSFMYLTSFGTILAVGVGMLVSLLTGSQDLTLLDPRLISPPLRRFLPKKKMQEYERQQVNLMEEMKDIIVNKE